MFITASMISFLWASDYLRDLPKHHIENPCVPMGQKSVYEECTVQSGQLWDFSCADSLVMRSISQWSHVFGTDPKWHSRSPVKCQSLVHYSVLESASRLRCPLSAVCGNWQHSISRRDAIYLMECWISPWVMHNFDKLVNSSLQSFNEILGAGVLSL